MPAESRRFCVCIDKLDRNETTNTETLMRKTSVAGTRAMPKREIKEPIPAAQAIYAALAKD